MAKRTRKKEIPPNFLKAWRKESGLTQQQLADMVGTSKSQISDLESGKRDLDSEWAHRLAPKLGARPGWLFDYSPDDPELALIKAWRKRA